MRTQRVWPALAALLILSALVPSRVAADSSTRLRQKAVRLQQENVRLTVRSENAVLGLYALDSELTRNQAHATSLQIQIAQVRAERATAQMALASARRSLAAAQRMLAVRVQQLYEQGSNDSLDVLLGARSVVEALNGLDTLDRVADADRLVIEQARSARTRYRAEVRALATREQRLTALARDAASTALRLQQARSERAAYLASLASARGLNAAAISSLQEQAQAIDARATQVSAISAAGSASTAGRTMTVSATAYSMPGRTATGARVGWGIVAVDPHAIPLGTRMTIPGYGEGVAADTGLSVVGATIDLWFPTLAKARAWGRRTVTITLH
jgi:3D (Asp-Asp-Asp) domain-containing protein